MAFWFDIRGTDFLFAAGQNADFTIPDLQNPDEEGNKRTFSLAASPHHKNSIMIATRMRNTAFKNALKEFPFGTKLLVQGPMGNMTLHDDATKPAVLLAGGIGITPFRSMIEWATYMQLQHEIWLFYSNKTVDATSFLDDLTTWQQRNPHLHVILTVTDEDAVGPFRKGRITPELLRSHLGDDLRAPIYYSAGPPAMVEAMKTMLLDIGLSRENIQFESFDGY